MTDNDKKSILTQVKMSYQRETSRFFTLVKLRGEMSPEVMREVIIQGKTLTYRPKAGI